MRNDLPLRLALLAGLSFAAPAWGNPTGAQVISGGASIETQGKTLTITNTPSAVIHWQGFSIAADEWTRFLQQSPMSAVLNRVVGGQPSEILGRLSSNGRVFLINPSGIAFGEDARIDVGGLVASTLNLSNADFLAGRLQFSGSGAEGPLQQRGEIVTPAGGRVVLVAPRIDAAGLIRSPSGSVVLAAGSSVTLMDSAFPDILVEVRAPADRELALGDLGSRNLFSLLIRPEARIDVSTPPAQPAVLAAAPMPVAPPMAPVLPIVVEQPLAGVPAPAERANASVLPIVVEQPLAVVPAPLAQVVTPVLPIVVEQPLAAAPSPTAPGTRGGSVILSAAADIVVAADARIDASGPSAGRVDILAGGRAQMDGEILARGTAAEASGGQVEVSGRRAVAIGGGVDTRAPSGTDGSLLIDPDRITVVAGATALPAALGDATWTPAEDPGSQSLGADTLGTLLATTSVTLQATQRIEVQDDAIVRVSATAPRRLTLEAPEIDLRGGVHSAGAPLAVELKAPSGNVRIASTATLALAGGGLSVDAERVSAQNLGAERAPADTALARTADTANDLARLRAEVEAEIRRDAERIARAIADCSRVGAYRKGCAIHAPARRKFVFAGA